MHIYTCTQFSKSNFKIHSLLQMCKLHTSLFVHTVLGWELILPVEVVFCLQLRLFQIEVLLQQDKARDLIILPHDQSLCSSEAGV